MGMLDTHDGFVLTGDDALGSGGRGGVFPVVYWGDRPTRFDDVDVVCKVVENRHRSKGRERKVEELVSLGERVRVASTEPGARSLSLWDLAAWPLASVFDEGAWAGYLMRRVEGRTLAQARYGDGFTVSRRIASARMMCELVAEMHRLRLVVGDVSLANFIVRDGDDGGLCLIDLDSVQMVDEKSGCVYPTVESRDKSPEMLSGHMGDVILSSRSDDFLLAVEVFRLLFDEHPLDEYRADISPSEVRAANARMRRFGYAERACGCGVNSFGEDLGTLFRHSFTGAYETIPSASAYADCLRRLEAAKLSECSRCGVDHVVGSVDLGVEEPQHVNRCGFLDGAVSRETLDELRAVALKNARWVYVALAVATATALCAISPDLVGFVSAGAGNAANECVDCATTALGEAAAFAVCSVEEVKMCASSALESASAFVSGAVDAAADAGASAFAWLAEAVPTYAGEAASFVADVAGEGGASVLGEVEPLLSAALNELEVDQSVLSGLCETADSAKDAACEVVASAADSIEEWLAGF